jgi:hypothetical protein
MLSAAREPVSQAGAPAQFTGVLQRHQGDSRRHHAGSRNSTRTASAEVTYSFIWELCGRETPLRNAEIDVLFNRPRPGGGGRPR